MFVNKYINNMPNKTGGKKYKKHKKHNRKTIPMEWADETQCYARVEERMGGKNFKLYCSDKKTRTGIIRGKMIRRTWLTKGDIVLVNLNTHGDGSDNDKCEIHRKYNDNEKNTIESRGYLKFLENENDEQESNYTFHKENDIDDDGDEVVQSKNNKKFSENTSYSSIYHDIGLDDSDDDDDEIDDKIDDKINDEINDEKDNKKEKTKNKSDYSLLYDNDSPVFDENKSFTNSNNDINSGLYDAFT